MNQVPKEEVKEGWDGEEKVRLGLHFESYCLQQFSFYCKEMNLFVATNVILSWNLEYF